LKPRNPPNTEATQIANCGGSTYALFGQSVSVTRLYSGIERITAISGTTIIDANSDFNIPVFGLRPEQCPAIIATTIETKQENTVIVIVVNTKSNPSSLLLLKQNKHYYKIGVKD
jgi:hypothetical protein